MFKFGQPIVDIFGKKATYIKQHTYQDRYHYIRYEGSIIFSLLSSGQFTSLHVKNSPGRLANSVFKFGGVK